MSNITTRSITTPDGAGEAVFAFAYAPMLVITSYNTIIRDGDRNWQLRTNQQLPYVCTGDGMPEDGAFASLGSAAAGTAVPQLASPGVLAGTLPISSEVDTIQLSDVGHLQLNDHVRIFGAAEAEDLVTTSGLGLTVSTVGFTDPTTGDDATEISYRIRQFNLETGAVSPAGDAVAVSILTEDLENFNNANNIQLTYSKASSSWGVLVYRRVGSETQHHLVAVLGTEGVGASSSGIGWTDYYTYAITPWADANSAGHLNVVYLPTTADSAARRGWIDTTITSIDTAQQTIRVADTFWSEASGACSVELNHTPVLQQLIDENQRLELPPGEFTVSELVLPQGFSVSGSGEQSQLRRLSWSSTSNNHMISAVETNTDGDVDLQLRNFHIMGNGVNQWLVDDDRNPHANYAVRSLGNGITIDGVTGEDFAAGGCWLWDEDQDTSTVSIRNSRLERGSVSYQRQYSPLWAPGVDAAQIQGNTFRNFPAAVNCNAVTRSVVQGNIIENCGSGLEAYGAVNSQLSPNVLIGPAGEFLQAVDRLNSEYDSVNIQLEPGVDYISPSVVYQENGAAFDLTLNRGEQSAAINELVRANGCDVVGDDYSVGLGGADRIQFDESAEASEGEFKFRISSAQVNDLLSVASYDQLYTGNVDSAGLIYRIFHTEYVPMTEVTAAGEIITGTNQYRIRVADADNLAVNDQIRFDGHNSTPSLDDVVGTIVEINRLNPTITIQYDQPVTTVGDSGTITRKNTFIVLKGKIN